MSLPYDLNLATAFACALALFSWIAFWFVPIAVRALWTAAGVAARKLKVQFDRRDPPGGALAEPSRDPWWGPHQASH